MSLYDTLFHVHYTPLVALNRAIVGAEHEGPDRGLIELAAIDGCECLSAYPFYAAAFGELAFRCGRIPEARARLAPTSRPLRDRVRPGAQQCRAGLL